MQDKLAKTPFKNRVSNVFYVYFKVYSTNKEDLQLSNIRLGGSSLPIMNIFNFMCKDKDGSNSTQLIMVSNQEMKT